MASLEEDEYLQQKMDYEIKMRDGTAKLLAASRHPHQMLEAAKNLLTSNTRMLAYMAELQSRKTQQVINKSNPSAASSSPPDNRPAPACNAKLAISDIRIPLMWKDGLESGRSSRHSSMSSSWAVFCMLTIGTEIYDTVLLKDVNKLMTDVCFEDVIVFTEIPADFQLKFDVFCHKLSCDDDVSSSTPRRIKKRFSHISNSVGRSVGKRLSGLKDDPEFMANMLVGPKFELIGSGTLSLEDVSDYIQTFDLKQEESSGTDCLRLFGNFCCRLAAQPQCMLTASTSGQLDIKVNHGAATSYWCDLRRLQISCWNKQEHSMVNSLSPATTVPVSKFGKHRKHRTHISISAYQGGEDVHYTLTPAAAQAAEGGNSQAVEQWWKAIQQHLVDQEQWKHACDQLMEIRPASPHKVPVFLRKGSSHTSTVTAADETDSDSPMTRILNRLNVMDPLSPLSSLPETTTATTPRTTTTPSSSSSVPSSLYDMIDVDEDVAAASSSSASVSASVGDVSMASTGSDSALDARSANSVFMDIVNDDDKESDKEAEGAGTVEVAKDDVLSAAASTSSSETKPVESETKPVESETEPVESETEPVESEIELVESEIKVVESEIKAVESETKPEECETETKSETETQAAPEKEKDVPKTGSVNSPEDSSSKQLDTEVKAESMETEGASISDRAASEETQESASVTESVDTVASPEEGTEENEIKVEAIESKPDESETKPAENKENAQETENADSQVDQESETQNETQKTETTENPDDAKTETETKTDTDEAEKKPESSDASSDIEPTASDSNPPSEITQDKSTSDKTTAAAEEEVSVSVPSMVIRAPEEQAEESQRQVMIENPAEKVETDA